MTTAPHEPESATVVALPRAQPAPDLAVATLGPGRIDSPLGELLDHRATGEHYVDEHDRVLFDDTLAGVTARGGALADLPGMEPCGPRRKIFFDPAKTRAAIVTCGGLCPGLNDVIAGLVRTLTYHYQVRRVIGIRNGYQGFVPSYKHDVVDLTPESVRDIATDGGTVLGTSRGPQDPDEIVDCLERLHVNVLFVVGGDGSMRGAMRIAETVAERGLYIAVVGIPKTIDNDYFGIDFTFGFFTAVDVMAKELLNLRADAVATQSYYIVSTMGRRAGWLAYGVAIAGEAHLVLGMEDAQGALLDAEGKLDLDQLAELVVELISARQARGKRYGVVLLAEGLSELLSDKALAGAPRDQYGHVSFGTFDLSRSLSARTSQRFDQTFALIQRTQMLEKTLRTQLSPQMSAALRFSRTLGSQVQ